MNTTENRYRLRKQNEIVGYMRKINEKSLFYSPDGFWWSGRQIAYDEIDEWTGLQDKHRKLLYEWDIVRFKIDPEADYSVGAVLWQEQNKQFVIRPLDEDVCFPLAVNDLQLFNQDQLEVFSHLFLNPDIKAHLGIES